MCSPDQTARILIRGGVLTHCFRLFVPTAGAEGTLGVVQCMPNGGQSCAERTKASLVQREVPPSFGAPAKPSVSGFAGERRSSGMSELLPSRQNEEYEACDDEAEGLFPKGW